MASSTKKGRPSKAEAERKRRLAEKKAREEKRYQLGAILLFALAIFLSALTFIKGERLWKTLHDVLFGVFGPIAYAVGPMTMYVALVTAVEKRVRSRNAWLSAGLITAVCGALLIFGDASILAGDTLMSNLQILYIMGVEGVGGGLLSALLGWTLLSAFGKTGAAITIVLVIFVLGMLLTGKTIGGMVYAVKSAGDRARERRAERLELSEAEEQEEPAAPEAPAQTAEKRAADKKFDIDVPLNGSKKKKNVDVALDGKTGEFRIGHPEALEQSRIDIPLGPAPVSAEAPIDPLPVERAARAPFEPKPIGADGFTFANSAESEARQPSADTPEAHVREFFDNLKQPDGELDELISKAASKGKTAAAAQPEPKEEYRFPPVSLLKKSRDTDSDDVSAELRANADKLVKTLDSFGVQTRVIDISRGPTVTRYELQPYSGVKISRISSLSDDIALNLATESVRIEAPIPNKSAVGIEVPNRDKKVVSLRSVIESAEFKNSKEPLTIALGKDVDGQVRVTDVAKMPHMLIAGATGSGKSVCINSIIMSVFYKAAPEDVRLILIDPKSVELIEYNGVPHLLIPVVTDPRKAAGALGWAVTEMMKRYKLFAEKGVKNLESYNKYVDNYLKNPPEQPSEEGAQPAEPPVKLPRILIIIDELADLMMASPNEVEDAICRLAQLARAAGMHLIVATQRPSVDVVTGLIKANIPSRIAFTVASAIDSRTILGNSGAEKLIGRGDMLFQPMDLNKPVRIQGCYVSEEETAAVIDYVKKSTSGEYNEAVMQEIEKQAALTDKANGKTAAEEDDDPMLNDAIDTVVEAGSASTSLLQRRLKLGYARAARIMDAMEDMGIIGAADGAKPRQVLMSRQQWTERKLRSSED